MTKTSSGSDSDGGSECSDDAKSKALSEKELQKEKKRTAHDRLFVVRTKKTKHNEQVKIKDFIAQTIPLAGVLSTKESKLKPSFARFQKFNAKAAQKDAQLVLPSIDEMNEVDTLRLKYAALKSTATEQRPPDFWPQLKHLKEQINAIEPQLKETIKEIGDAASCYHLSRAMENVCLKADDIENGSAWNELVQSLVCLGVPDVIDTLSTRKKEAEVKAAAAKRKKEEESKAAAAAAKAQRQQAATLVADVESSSSEAAAEEAPHMVRDGHGQVVELDSILTPGELSSRDRDLKPKKRSVNPAPLPSVFKSGKTLSNTFFF